MPNFLILAEWQKGQSETITGWITTLSLTCCLMEKLISTA